MIKKQIEQISTTYDQNIKKLNEEVENLNKEIELLRNENANNKKFKIKYEGNYVMVYEKSPKTGKYVRVASVEARLFCQGGN